MKTSTRQCCLLLAAAAFNSLSAIQASPGKQEIEPRKPDKKADLMNSSTASEKVIEFLILDIKPGRRDEFHTRYVTKSVPLLKSGTLTWSPTDLLCTTRTVVMSFAHSRAWKTGKYPKTLFMAAMTGSRALGTRSWS